jgi:uncharacterized protein (DUF433 family)
MKTETVGIVDIGRGPQIEGHRLTVMDVFYYLHRGHDFDYIRCALPSLAREQFEAVVAYVNAHRDELVARDRQAEEQIRQGLVRQKAKGLSHDIDESVPVEDRAGRLKETVRKRSTMKAETDGGHAPR